MDKTSEPIAKIEEVKDAAIPPKQDVQVYYCYMCHKNQVHDRVELCEDCEKSWDGGRL